MTDITPEEIRIIRQSLGLTQVEAGELLGGGPRAFTKYESGTIKPAAAVVSLLRVLEANPDALAALGGIRSKTINAPQAGPFEVTGEHVKVLTERDLPVLLRKLLISEAQSYSLPTDGIHVASNIHAPDGGEDGRIEWTGGPEGTPNLLSRLCQFQLKAGSITPNAAVKEVMAGNGQVKEMVSSNLENGGNYILLCAQSYTQQAIVERKQAILEALRSAGLEVLNSQVDFKDADQLASWVNSHPSVSTWVKEKTQPGALGPFRSWEHWAGRSEHDSSPHAEDDRSQRVYDQLHERVKEPRSSVRFVGLYGVGKSRLILDALAPTEKDGTAGSATSDLVLYAVESEAPPGYILETVQNLADLGTRAIVVVDDCTPESHRSLAGIVSRAGSRLSLVTIDNEIPPGGMDEATFVIGQAPPAVTEGIINQVGGLKQADRHRLAQLSEGFPGMCARVARAWAKELSIGNATDDDLVNDFVLGRNSHRPTSLLKSATLIATCQPVQVEPDPEGWVSTRGPAGPRIADLAKLGDGPSSDELYADIQELHSRGVVRLHGRLAILEPRPIALKLAERQWRDWTKEKWDQVLGGATNPVLKCHAARQLALLNTTKQAQEVVKWVCRVGGPLEGIDGVRQPGHSEALSALAEVGPEAVAELLRRFIDTVDDLHEVGGGLRRQLVATLEKIAFHPDTFEEGTLLLLGLAVAENEPWGNNATEQFKALFPMILGNTAADGKTRLLVLDSISNTDDIARRNIVVEGLIKGAETHHFSRFGNAGAHGSRPSLDSWRPSTGEEAKDYIEGCVKRLVKFAKGADEPAERALTGLGHQLRSLAYHGFVDVVEEAVQEITVLNEYWPEALESLSDVVKYDVDRISSEVIGRVKSLIAVLEPKDLDSRLRFIVTEMPWDFPCDEQLDFDTRNERQAKAVRELAEELVGRPKILARYLPVLSSLPEITGLGRTPQRRTFDFGLAVAELSDSPSDWVKPITEAFFAVQERERDTGLLVGYIVGMVKRCPEAEKYLKQFISDTPELAMAFPQICLRLGIVSSDIPLALCAFTSGRINSSHLTWWTLGGQLSQLPAEAVAPLFDAMLDSGAKSYSVALDLMVMYAHGDQDKLEDFRPQIQQAIDRLSQLVPDELSRDTIRNFSDILAWLLGKGREDEDARTAAMKLAKEIVDNEGLRDRLDSSPLVPTLLSHFPEIAWPIIGQAIISGPDQTFMLKSLLGEPLTFGDRSDPAILSLPEDVLFAWCHANPGQAPVFAGEALPFLTSLDSEDPERCLHPAMTRLIDEFGHRDDVWQAISTNINTFGWIGSTTAYFELLSTSDICSLGSPNDDGANVGQADASRPGIQHPISPRPRR